MLLSAFISNGELMLSRYANTTSDSAPRSGGIIGRRPLPGITYSLAMARRTWSAAHNNLYFDRPNLLTHRTSVRADKEGELIYRRGFDIVASQMQVMPSAQPKAFSLRLQQGVLETVAEGFLLPFPMGPVQNTAELLARSPAQQISWIPLRARDDPAWKS